MDSTLTHPLLCFITREVTEPRKVTQDDICRVVLNTADRVIEYDCSTFCNSCCAQKLQIQAPHRVLGGLNMSMIIMRHGYDELFEQKQMQ